MPVMVDFHGLGVDVRLERIGGIGQRREHEGAGRGGRGSGAAAGAWANTSAWRDGGSGDAGGHRDEMAAG